MSMRGPKSAFGYQARIIGLAIGLIMCVAPAPAWAAASFEVVSVDAQLSGSELVARTRLEMSLSEQSEFALERGVALQIMVEMALHRRRAMIWDKRLARWQFPVELRYHALSNRYILNASETGEFETFRTVGDALRALGSPTTYTVQIPESLSADLDQLRFSIRARLDIEALPTPLRLKAYLSPDWRLSSGWTQWDLHP